MILTLATDYSELRGVLAFPAAVLMFLGAVWAALLISRARWNAAWILVVIWGLAYPIVQVAMSARVLLDLEGVWLQALVPSVVTTVVLGLATRSGIPVTGCVLGWIASVLVVDERFVHQWPGLLAVPWNLCVGPSLVGWAWWLRVSSARTGVCPGCGFYVRGLPGEICPLCEPRRMAPEGTCAKCGYDVSRVTGRVCPECGVATRGGTGK
ncbi:MAG: hypothetical protein QM783_20130 [Phycisphaerales bacterium]